MMKKWIALLGILLLIQIALAVMLNTRQQQYQAFTADQPLLAVDAAGIDGLRLADMKQGVLLKKRDGGWVLPDEDGFPADARAVGKLLDRLTGLKRGWPVATTDSAARRFRLTDDDFERRIELLDGDRVVATLYVGTSPGLRKVHVRVDGDDAIHAVTLNSWEIAVGSDDWIDKDVLGIEPADVTRIELPAVTLVRDGDGMVIEDMPGRTDADEARSVLDRLAGLQIRGLVDDETAGRHHGSDKGFIVKLTRKDGTVLEYRFDPAGDEGWYVLKRSDQPRYFRVDGYVSGYLKDMTRKQLEAKQEDAAGH